MRRYAVPAVLFLMVGVLAVQGSAAEGLLRGGDYVAVAGDSITEQRLYSMFIEDYLLMCKPAADLRVTQFGWGGETAPGFAMRMANDMLRFEPNVATTCFGMNDGGYSPMDPAKAERYRKGQRSVVAQMKKANVRVIVVGSPGCVDADTFKHDPEIATMYNKTLSQMRDIAQQVAQEEGVKFADVFDPMVTTMTKAKAKYGKQYHVGGGDGVHPDRNGHLVMAYAFLKALGCDGNIGTITIDLTAGKAEATEGHKVLSCTGGQAEIESCKYPFCFFGDPAVPASTRGVLEFLPFNEDLNRFQLVVRGLTSGKGKVTWGSVSREFTAAELSKGINLAAEFLDNPFSKPFQAVESQVVKQQNMETTLVKSLLHSIPDFKRIVPAEQESLDRICGALMKQDREARDASAAAVVPVRHVLKVEAVQ